MKSFVQELIAVIAICILSLAATAVKGQEKNSGSYSIYTKENIIQTDTFEIIPGTSYVDEIKGVSAGETDRRFELLLENGRFQSLEKKVNGIVETSVKLEKGVFSFYEKTAMVAAVPDENNSPVFEAAAYSNYALLANFYDRRKGGKQTLAVMIPALQDLINVEMEQHGTDGFTVGEQTLTATHYRMAVGKKRETVNLWVENNRVIAIYTASNNRFIIDNAFPQLYDRVKQVINKAM